MKFSGNSHQRRKMRRLYEAAFGNHVDYYMEISIKPDWTLGELKDVVQRIITRTETELQPSDLMVVGKLSDYEAMEREYVNKLAEALRIPKEYFDDDNSPGHE